MASRMKYDLSKCNETKRLLRTLYDALRCPLCELLLENPYKAHCCHVCERCARKSFYESKEQTDCLSCPACGELVATQSLLPDERFSLNVVGVKKMVTCFERIIGSKLFEKVNSDALPKQAEAVKINDQFTSSVSKFKNGLLSNRDNINIEKVIYVNPLTGIKKFKTSTPVATNPRSVSKLSNNFTPITTDSDSENESLRGNGAKISTASVGVQSVSEFVACGQQTDESEEDLYTRISKLINCLFANSNIQGSLCIEGVGRFEVNLSKSSNGDKQKRNSLVDTHTNTDACCFQSVSCQVETTQVESKAIQTDIQSNIETKIVDYECDATVSEARRGQSDQSAVNNEVTPLYDLSTVNETTADYSCEDLITPSYIDETPIKDSNIEKFTTDEKKSNEQPESQKVKKKSPKDKFKRIRLLDDSSDEEKYSRKMNRKAIPDLTEEIEEGSSSIIDEMMDEDCLPPTPPELK
ncbi:hypothetical protein B4U79_17248 [Dinothrombium tinctorium]|uniref:Uncharacterized protein n=1 Tax=Dinothrombium tinctorium TaxID=1965070 RepID=A0A3S3P9D4_9ACAR|nr:hypothetical protein B4U79_17248 [Dinothrombium tinctorium]